MKLLADDKIPHLKLFAPFCDEIAPMPGEKISAEDVRDADLLLVRTVTQVNQALLQHSTIQWVGSPTTGTDHIDIDYLQKNGIGFAAAEGANSQAVTEYVLCCIAALLKTGHLQHTAHIGIIGYGRIGKKLAYFLEKLGFTYLVYDPYVASPHQTSLDTLLKNADFITLHTPLTKTGPHPTYHMIDDTALQTIKPGAVLLNTARGSVIDEKALLSATHLIRCLDVFEHEPHISRELLDALTIATPHIAGYTVQAKYLATTMVFEQAAKFFGWGFEHPSSSAWPLSLPLLSPPSQYSTYTLSQEKKSDFFECCLTHYNPITHSDNFRKNLKNSSDIAAAFIEERKNAGFREEMIKS